MNFSFMDVRNEGRCPNCGNLLDFIESYTSNKSICRKCGWSKEFDFITGKIICNEPKESVSQGAFDQIKWERDVALDQLNDIGKGLGAKMDDVVKVVFCKDCKFGEACKNGRGEHGIMCYNSQSANKDWVHEPDWFCADGEHK